jgi:hypothetical protein
VTNWLRQRWEDITGWLKGVWDGIKSKASAVWDGISGAVTGAITKARDVLKGIWDGITSGVSSAWENIKRIVGDAVDWVKQRISDIGSGIGNAASWVGGLVGIGRNEGGWVPGNVAGPNKDSVPLLATPGEFVVKRGPAQAHKRELEALNDGGQMMPTMLGSPGALVDNAAGMGSLEGALAASTRAVPAGGMRPAVPVGGDGVSIGSVSLTQNVYNPLPEKPSVSLGRHTAAMARYGLAAAMTKGTS